MAVPLFMFVFFFFFFFFFLLTDIDNGSAVYYCMNELTKTVLKVEFDKK